MWIFLLTFRFWIVSSIFIKFTIMIYFHTIFLRKKILFLDKYEKERKFSSSYMFPRIKTLVFSGLDTKDQKERCLILFLSAFIISIPKIKESYSKSSFWLFSGRKSNETDLRIVPTVIVESHHITLVQLCCLKAPSVHEESLLVFMGRQKASCPKMAQR